jgi:hypothetical protein
MKKNNFIYIKPLIGILIIGIFLPQVVFAAWWNPFSWFNNWSFSEPKESEVEILQKEVDELKEKLEEKELVDNVASSTINAGVISDLEKQNQKQQLIDEQKKLEQERILQEQSKKQKEESLLIQENVETEISIVETNYISEFEILVRNILKVDKQHEELLDDTIKEIKSMRTTLYEYRDVGGAMGDYREATIDLADSYIQSWTEFRNIIRNEIMSLENMLSLIQNNPNEHIDLEMLNQFKNKLKEAKDSLKESQEISDDDIKNIMQALSYY